MVQRFSSAKNGIQEHSRIIKWKAPNVQFCKNVFSFNIPGIAPLDLIYLHTRQQCLIKALLVKSAKSSLLIYLHPKVLFRHQPHPKSLPRSQQHPQVLLRNQPHPKFLFRNRQLPEVLFRRQQHPQVLFRNEQLPTVLFGSQQPKCEVDLMFDALLPFLLMRSLKIVFKKQMKKKTSAKSQTVL